MCGRHFSAGRLVPSLYRFTLHTTLNVQLHLHLTLCRALFFIVIYSFLESDKPDSKDKNRERYAASESIAYGPRAFDFQSTPFVFRIFFIASKVPVFPVEITFRRRRRGTDRYKTSGSLLLEKFGPSTCNVSGIRRLFDTYRKNTRANNPQRGRAFGFRRISNVGKTFSVEESKKIKTCIKFH